MFESVELGRKLDKSAFRAAVPVLRAALQEAQAELFTQRKFPVVVLISSQDVAGKGESHFRFGHWQWMDPRFLSTLAFSEPSDEEFVAPTHVAIIGWHTTAGRAHGYFCGLWYSDPIRERIQGEISLKEFDARAQQINRFEFLLVNEGALVLKFWFTLTKDGQRARLKALESVPRLAMKRDAMELGPAENLRRTAGRGRPFVAHHQYGRNAMGAG